jgi:hypothetical protein
VDATNLWSEVPIGARVRRYQDREPQTGRLPDRTLHCPACGSEVQLLGAPSTPSGSGYHGEAYWAGWVDGRFRETGSFVNNPYLARWATPPERFDYYRGHRTGAKLAEGEVVGFRRLTRGLRGEPDRIV